MLSAFLVLVLDYNSDTRPATNKIFCQACWVYSVYGEVSVVCVFFFFFDDDDDDDVKEGV